MSAAARPLQVAGPLLMRGLPGSLQGPLAPWGDLGLQTAGFLMRGAHPNVMAIGWGGTEFPLEELGLGTALEERSVYTRLCLIVLHFFLLC